MKAVTVGRIGLILGCLFVRPASAQPSPEELDILRAIARVRAGDTATSPAKVWIVFLRTDRAVNLARFLGHPLVVAPSAPTVYCPSRKPRAGLPRTAASEQWFGHLASVVLNRKGPAMVLATVRLECWDEERPLPSGKPSRFYETREYQVVKRGGHWQAIAGMINVT